MALAKAALTKLISLADELKQGGEEKWFTRVDKVRKCIRQMAEAIESLS